MSLSLPVSMSLSLLLSLSLSLSLSSSLSLALLLLPLSLSLSLPLPLLLLLLLLFIQQKGCISLTIGVHYTERKINSKILYGILIFFFIIFRFFKDFFKILRFFYRFFSDLEIPDDVFPRFLSFLRREKLRHKFFFVGHFVRQKRGTPTTGNKVTYIVNHLNITLINNA